MAKRRKRKKKSKAWKYAWRGLLQLIKLPYYLAKGIGKLYKKSSQGIRKREVRKKREEMLAQNEEFKVLKAIEGDYDEWLNEVHKSDSKIGIIIGARGTGKTAFGMKFLENVYAKKKRKCFAIGFNEDELPSWIDVVEGTASLKNNSFVLVDEGGVLFSSRRAMSNANKMLSDLILISRHKNISILFISQNSSNLEVNVLRQADFLALKPSSLLQKEFERRIVRKMYDDVKEDFEELKEDKGLTYIYASKFRGFVSNPLPSFWKESISKSFKEK